MDSKMDTATQPSPVAQSPGWRQLPNPNRQAKPPRVPHTVSLPTETIVMSVRCLIQQKQFGSAATVAQTSLTMFNAVVPELYHSIHLFSLPSVYRFLWTHSKLCIPLGPRTHTVTENYSSGRRLARTRAYHSVIRHVDIQVQQPADYESQAWWSKQFAKFPRLPPDREPLKISTMHITTDLLKTSRGSDRQWIQGAIVMFQTQHFRYIYSSIFDWGSPEGLQAICKHWNMEYLQSIDVPCLLDRIPFAKFRWARPNAACLRGTFFGLFTSSLRQRFSHEKYFSPLSAPSTTALPICIILNTNAPLANSFLQGLQGNFYDPTELTKLKEVFHFADDTDISDLDSEAWRQWLKKDYWGDRR